MNAELKKYRHVNRKALDRYSSFAEQRNDLVKRKEVRCLCCSARWLCDAHANRWPSRHPPPFPIPSQENDRGEEKIRQLISTLDMRKDEALERTFKGVAKNFREIFALASVQLEVDWGLCGVSS